MSNQAVENKKLNWSCLIFLCAAAFFAVSGETSEAICKAAYPLLGTIALPGYVLLLGRKSRECLQGEKQTICAGLGLIVLGCLQKILVYWAKALLGLQPAFLPFSTAGIEWLFIVSGLYLVIAGLCSHWKWSNQKLLGAALLIGLLGGVMKPFDNFLCLAQMCAFLPFFALGRRMDGQWLSGWGERRWKLPAVGSLAAAGVACMFLRNKLQSIWFLIEGTGWYGSNKALNGVRLPIGMLLRLGWYAAALVLLWSLFCLAPKRTLPVLTRMGKYPVSGFFWYVPGAYFTLAPAMTRANGQNLLMSGVLTAALLVSAPLAHRFVEWIVNGPWRAVNDSAEPRKLERASFYQRHKWAIHMVGLFTLAFAVVMVAFYYPYDVNGKSLIWRTDGMGQQYPMMFYFKEYVMGAVENFLATGKLHFADWDFTLGFGMSPLDAVRREPFMLLSLLGNEETMEYIIDFSTVLRLYICGLTFIWYCATVNRREKLPVLMGSLVYLFSGFALFASVRQPFFTTTLMTYLVLMLIGTERYLQHNKYGVFVCSVFLQLFSGYYSAYINGLILALYLLVRLGCRYKKDILSIIKEICRMIGLYAWGAAMAMMVLLPSVMGYGASSRSDVALDFDLFYSNSYYTKLFTGLNLEFDGSGYWTYMSFAAIAWLACIVLFLRKREELRPLKVGLIATFSMLCIPFFGLLANGFAYVCNRWSFCIPLLAAFILVEMAPELVKLSGRDKGVILTIILVYAAVVVTRPAIISDERMIGLIVLCMTTMIVLMLDQVLKNERARMAVLAVITILTVMINCAASYLPALGDYVSEFQDRGNAYESSAEALELALEAVEEDKSFYRIAQEYNVTNQSMTLGYYGVSAYYSIIPGSITRYAIDTCLSSQIQSFRVCGLEERAVPTALASVKYYWAEENKHAPYGFVAREEFKDENGTYTLYENENALPLGYTYDSYIPQEEYDQLTPLEKQQVMLEHAVIAQTGDGLEMGTVSFRQEEIPVEVTKLSNAEINVETGKISSEAGGMIYFSFEGKKNCETYLVLEGLRYENDNSSASCTVRAKGSGDPHETALRGKKQSYYFEREAAIFNLGYSEEAQSICTVSFSRNVDAVYDRCYIVCVPMDHYEEEIAQRKENVLENVVEKGDYIYGTIELEECRLLSFSVPYSEGWKAYVNGQEQELQQVNTMYCGLILEPGSYEIELRYEAPGERAGSFISAVAIAAVIPVAGVPALRRKKAKKS